MPPEPTKERPSGNSEGAGGQPVLPSSLERFVYAVGRTDGGVTAHMGLPVMIEGFHVLGVAASCQRHLRLKSRRRGPTEAEWVELFTGLHQAGGKCPEDINRLKEDDGLVRVWPVLRKVSPRSALGRVNRDLLATVQRHHPVPRATLDVDASIHACDKKTALPTYEGGRGYQPVVAYWVEQRLIVAEPFRDGNVPAAMGNPDFVRHALAMVPPEVTERYLRADSALYDQRLMRELDRAGVGFAISADLTVELRAEIGRAGAPPDAPAALAPDSGVAWPVDGGGGSRYSGSVSPVPWPGGTRWTAARTSSSTQPTSTAATT